MTTMLEKMAAAMRTHWGEPEDTLLGFESLARAAILAIREPEEDVREAGVAAMRADPHNINPYQAWSAMIDAILNEKPETGT